MPGGGAGVRRERSQTGRRRVGSRVESPEIGRRGGGGRGGRRLAPSTERAEGTEQVLNVAVGVRRLGKIVRYSDPEQNVVEVSRDGGRGTIGVQQAQMGVLRG